MGGVNIHGHKLIDKKDLSIHSGHLYSISFQHRILIIDCYLLFSEIISVSLLFFKNSFIYSPSEKFVLL